MKRLTRASRVPPSRFRLMAMAKLCEHIPFAISTRGPIYDAVFAITFIIQDDDISSLEDAQKVVGPDEEKTARIRLFRSPREEIPDRPQEIQRPLRANYRSRWKEPDPPVTQEADAETTVRQGGA